jgi:hypothetical protein
MYDHRYYKISKEREAESDLLVSTIRRADIATMQNANADEREID